MSQMDPPLLTEELTEREQEILELISQGLTNREIAGKLILSTETIKWYNKQLYSKLAVSSRTQAVHQARQLGLLGTTPADRPQPKTRPNNLPASPSSFIGRKHEIARIKHLLQTHRLVTLTGPGGSGKTRLALETVREMLPLFKDGAWLIELGGINTSDQALKIISAALTLNPPDGEQTLPIIRRYLAGKLVLLLVDSLEHLLDFAPTLGEILAAAPRLRILATSRERLNLDGEQEFNVLPLHIPDLKQENDPDKLQKFEAVDLFIQRAGNVDADFEPTPQQVHTIAQICRRLDGLPLAIELAAARARLFSPEQLLAGLDNRLDLLTDGTRDAPARQRTLRAAIAWSYDLLTENERILFARLGAFEGSVTIDAVETVCRIDPAIAPLTSLLNKNLLFRTAGESTSPRLAMLETIHEFAREILRLIGEETPLRDRQLSYYLSLAESWAAGYRYQNHARFLKRTELELPNLRATFAWAMQHERYTEAARLVTALDYFFHYLHLLSEGYGWARQVLEVADTLPPEIHAPFLLAASRLAMYSANLKYGKQLAERGLALAEKLGNRELSAWLQLEIACTCDFPEEKDQAFELAENGLAFFRKTGDQSGIAYSLNILGEFYRLEGRFDRAKAVYNEALDLTIETGEALRQSFINANLSILAYHRGDYSLAKQLCESAIGMRLEAGQFFNACTGLAFLAGPLLGLGQAKKAARLLGAADSIHVQYGTEYQHTDLPEVEKIKSAIQAELGRESFTRYYEEGAAMNAYEAVDYALNDSNGSTV